MLVVMGKNKTFFVYVKNKLFTSEALKVLSGFTSLFYIKKSNMVPHPGCILKVKNLISIS